MRFGLKIAAFSITIVLSGLLGITRAGVLKSLDNELTSLVEKTEPYLVTVKGEGGWKNLIGTGIIYNSEGYVITSSEVYNADKHQVTFKKGISYPAEKIGVDRQTGLAVLKITADNLRSPLWGESKDLKSGAWIMVVGNSYGTPATVNFGIYDGRTDEGLLKLGVGVSPGASGGAVLNTDGKVVGILIAREAESIAGLSEYIRSVNQAPRNFKLSELMGNARDKAIAAPIETAIDIARQVIEDGRVRRGFLGISQKSLTSEELKELKVGQGVMVVDIVAGSPAETAGLKDGDIITRVDDRPITGSSCLFSLIRSHKPADEITVVYMREGKLSETTAVLGEADGDMMTGGLRLKDFLPGLSAGKMLELPEKSDLKEQMTRLENELSRLREEFDKLRDKIEN